MHETAHAEGPLAHPVDEVAIQLRLLLDVLPVGGVNLLELCLDGLDVLLSNLIYLDILTFSNKDIVAPQQIFLDSLPRDLGSLKSRLVQHQSQLEHIVGKHGWQHHSLHGSHLALGDVFQDLGTLLFNESELITGQ